VIDFLAEKGFSEEFGAREVKRTIYQELEVPLSKKILEGEIISPSKIKTTLKGGKINFEVIKKSRK